MTDEHERFEALAVGHVLGGLDAGEAADFRSHLLGCRDCRTRVAELRDIAADLAAAERDERARSRVRTEVARRADDEVAEDEPAPGPRVTVRHVTIASVLVIVLAALMGFWNLHLRSTTSNYAAVAEQRGETLEELATGVVVGATLADGMTGLVVVDGEDVAFTLAGVPDLAPGERLVAWLTGREEGDVPALLVRHVEDGLVAATLDDEGATTLVITRERGEPEAGPSGDELLRATLER